MSLFTGSLSKNFEWTENGLRALRYLVGMGEKGNLNHSIHFGNRYKEYEKVSPGIGVIGTAIPCLKSLKST